MAIDVKPLRKEPTWRDTRCRYCWARIRRGTMVAVDGSMVFHVECPPRFTGFPEINRLTDDGPVPDDMSKPERDDYYTNVRE